MAAKSRNRISMQPMRSEGGCHGVKGLPFYSCGCVVGGFFFQVVFELWCGECSVHFPFR